MAAPKLLTFARSLLWQAWTESAEEIASAAVEVLAGRGMLVEEGGAAELEKLRAEVAVLREATGAPASESTTTERLAGIAARAEAAKADPFFLSDCEGTLKVWRESALLNVIRGGNGDIEGWREPFAYRPSDLVLEMELDSWDPGEDEEDDRRRTDINALVTARQDDVPALLAYVERLRSEAVASRAAALNEAADKAEGIGSTCFRRAETPEGNGAFRVADAIRRLVTDERDAQTGGA